MTIREALKLMRAEVKSVGKKFSEPDARDLIKKHGKEQAVEELRKQLKAVPMIDQLMKAVGGLIRMRIDKGEADGLIRLDFDENGVKIDGMPFQGATPATESSGIVVVNNPCSCPRCQKQKTQPGAN